MYDNRKKRLTEDQTRTYYNRSDQIYRSFWDKDGNCHWGYFENDQISFFRSMAELNRRMLKFSQINKTSTVLDLGCGNGNNSFFLLRKTGARVTGLDLSDIRIANANKRLNQFTGEKQKLTFIRGSATDLPFKDGSFSNVWSQATIYHVHDKKKALAEVARIIKKGGIFIFDDLIKPTRIISKAARSLVYERLLFDTNFDLVTYQEELKKLGFRILYAEDLSRHFALSYWKLADIAAKMIEDDKNRAFHKEYKKLIHAYRKTWDFVEKGDVGWALFVACRL